MSFEGKNLYGQYIDYSEKKKWPKGFICPYTGTIFYIIHIYSRSQVSVYRTIGPLVFLVFFSQGSFPTKYKIFRYMPSSIQHGLLQHGNSFGCNMDDCWTLNGYFIILHVC